MRLYLASEESRFVAGLQLPVFAGPGVKGIGIHSVHRGIARR